MEENHQNEIIMDEKDEPNKASDLKNENLRKLNQDLNDFFDQKQLDIMGFLKDREKMRKIEQKNNRIKIQQIQEKLQMDNKGSESVNNTQPNNNDGDENSAIQIQNSNIQP